MKIAIIANNYGENYDGIGMFACVQKENFPLWIKSEIYSAKCLNDVSKVKKILNFGMTKEILKVCKNLKKQSFDTILIEYPFVEWNPIIVVALFYLKKVAKQYKTNIVLSLHEYERVNNKRKRVIRYMCGIANLVMVADEKMKNSISEFASNIEIRPIPTNVYDKMEYTKQEVERSGNSFVYFGLVNKSKAFNEMLRAWEKFYANNDCTLYILSSTILGGIEDKYNGVKYLYNKDNKTILSVMQQCVTCIIPVIPEIDMKNATFKTGSVAGCFCAGKFCDEYKELPFVYNMLDYSVEEFLKVFRNTENLSVQEKKEISQMAKEYGLRFTPQKTSAVVANILKTFNEETKNDNLC